ncbi:hypothetical protein K488DRAFT_85971 [Vararia minispora EC-137]|uniref:Uncharacterized protein n=1 Tax=Vararia minispora EC-137 TaxID=1314806 RepID=A0ACB8QKW2_9AGAM|nr:hypothetical protein K488DRAFT_85971 [Vararia minispora EC-137]
MPSTDRKNYTLQFPAELLIAIFFFVLSSETSFAPAWARAHGTQRSPSFSPWHVDSSRQTLRKTEAASRRAILSLSGVCKQWRRIILSSSSPYHIPCPLRDPTATCQLILSLAPLPISLNIDEEKCHDGGSEWEAVKAALVISGSRLRSVHLWLQDHRSHARPNRDGTSQTPTFDISTLFASCFAPSLQYFYVRSYPNPSHRALNFTSSRRPRIVAIPPSSRSSLRIVEIDGCQLVNPEVLCDVPQKTSHIATSIYSSASLDPYTSHVQQLSLSNTALRSFSPDLSRRGPLMLPHLTHLHLAGSAREAVAFLRGISFPTFSSLDLRLHAPDRASLEALTERLAEHFAPAHSSFEFSSILIAICNTAVRIVCDAPYGKHVPHTTFSLCLLGFADKSERDDAVADVCAVLPLRGTELAFELLNLSDDTLRRTYPVIDRLAGIHSMNEDTLHRLLYGKRECMRGAHWASAQARVD